jgi:hypothetical protein
LEASKQREREREGRMARWFMVQKYRGLRDRAQWRGHSGDVHVTKSLAHDVRGR